MTLAGIAEDNMPQPSGEGYIEPPLKGIIGKLIGNFGFSGFLGYLDFLRFLFNFQGSGPI